MLTVTRPTLSHMGLYVTDIERMVGFYKKVFGLVETDRGVGKTFKMPLVFLSASPDQHHQLAIAGGRPPAATFSTVMQISFMVPSIQDLRNIGASAQLHGATNVRNLNHGNALSIYFADPEGNTVEVYVDTPFYVAQPFGEPLDLTLDDQTILSQTEAMCRQDPSFMPVQQWEASMRQKLADTRVDSSANS